MNDATKKSIAVTGQEQTTPTSDRADIQSTASQSAAPRKSTSELSTPHPSARQRTSSTLPTSSGTERKKARAPMSRQRRKCVVCHPPNCKEIQQAFLRWRSPSEIAREYGLADHRPIYRHMHATRIFARRCEKLRLALDPLIAKVMDVKVTAHAILRAIATSDNLKDARKWIGRPEINAAVADEAERTSNRETAELEPDATRSKQTMRTASNRQKTHGCGFQFPRFLRRTVCSPMLRGWYNDELFVRCRNTQKRRSRHQRLSRRRKPRTMRIEDFNERLKQVILVADGAMGSLLYEFVGPQRCVDELNVTHGEAVFHVHQTYIEAGAQIIETNTFSANRHKLGQFGMADRVAELNHRAVKIAREAREAAKHEVLIAGSIGPLGILQHVRELPHQDIVAIFKEQAGALEERGVDLFLLETFSDIEELLAAVDGIRSFSRLPIVAQLTYSDEGTTFGGTRPQDAWDKLKNKDVQAIGANCTIGPQLLLPVLRELAASAQLPLSAMPNAGFPKRVGDRIVYPKSSPEYFALFAQEAAEIGTRIIGGCCGTTPEHIHAIAEAVKKLRSAKPRGAGIGSGAGGTVEVFEPAERFRRIAAREPESKLWKKIQAGEFVTSVEIDPPKGVTIDRILEQVGRVMASPHVDSIDINSGTLARVGMDALVLAGALEAHGYETVPHVTTRDANIIGLQAMLLGAWAVGGVRNVLAITGDPPSLGDHPETSGVYEVDSIGLVKVLSRLNQGTDWAGKSLGGATNFTIGVAVNPVAEDIDEELRRFEAKIEAGAHFAMTQPIFDPQHWQAFLKRLGGKSAVPIIVGLWPLTSYKQALRLNNEVPGIVIPKATLNEIEKAGDAARERGFVLARHMLDWARTARSESIAGAYLIAPFKRYEEILELF